VHRRWLADLPTCAAHARSPFAGGPKLNPHRRAVGCFAAMLCTCAGSGDLSRRCASACTVSGLPTSHLRSTDGPLDRTSLGTGNQSPVARSPGSGQQE
jgi:hypothetical protein